MDPGLKTTMNSSIRSSPYMKSKICLGPTQGVKGPRHMLPQGLSTEASRVESYQKDEVGGGLRVTGGFSKNDFSVALGGVQIVES